VPKNLLLLRLDERLVEYDPHLRLQWSDEAWWDAGGWRAWVPRADWDDAERRWKRQATTKKKGYHFVEVMHTRELDAAGLSWRYEGYDFFHALLRTAKGRQVAGYQLIESAFPTRSLKRLQVAASKYELRYGKPGTPDLFVYRLDEARAIPVRFVELKHGRREEAQPRQLLGLALIREFLDVDVEVVRYAPYESGALPWTWECDWPLFGPVGRCRGRKVMASTA
jgi:hypothetical protein